MGTLLSAVAPTGSDGLTMVAAASAVVFPALCRRVARPSWPCGRWLWHSLRSIRGFGRSSGGPVLSLNHLRICGRVIAGLAVRTVRETVGSESSAAGPKLGQQISPQHTQMTKLL